MKPAPFEYFSPTDLAQAIELLAEHGDEAKILAGGQSLLPLLAFRLAAPSVLIDLNRIDALSYSRLDGRCLILGALTRHRRVETLQGLSDWSAMIAEAVPLIGHVAIRNRGSVGGSIAHADPAAEWPALAVALDAEIDAEGPAGCRTIPAAEFFVSHFTTVLEPTEIVTEVRLRHPEGDRVGSSFVEFARRHGDFALAGAGVLLVIGSDDRISDARVALIGVREVAIRSGAAEGTLRGHLADDALFRAAAEAIDSDIEPPSDMHATGEDRRHFAKVLTSRALEIAYRRAVTGDGT